jgi:hypothetical protein
VRASRRAGTALAGLVLAVGCKDPQRPDRATEPSSTTAQPSSPVTGTPPPHDGSPGDGEVATPASTADTPAWRRAFGDLEELSRIQMGASTVQDLGRLMELQQAAGLELLARVAELPDDSPDLAEAACQLGTSSWGTPRRALETELRRGIAASRAAATDDVAKRFGALRAYYLSIEPGASFRGDVLEVRAGAWAIGGGAGQSPRRCAIADEGHLRLQLVELYDSEARHPVDPYTNKPFPGEPTTQRHQRSAALRELDALYRDLVAIEPADAALATVLDVASLHCPDARIKAAVCATPAALARRALTIREGALPPDADALAASRVVHARLLRERRTAARRDDEPERQLRRVLTDARAGTSTRLHAALDLLVVLGAGDPTRAREVEASLIADLAMPSNDDPWTWSEIARAAAALAAASGRGEDAARLLEAGLQGVARRSPDQRPGWELGLLDQLAAVDPARAEAVAIRTAKIRAELEAAQKAARQAWLARTGQ